MPRVNLHPSHLEEALMRETGAKSIEHKHVADSRALPLQFARKNHRDPSAVTAAAQIDFAWQMRREFLGEHAIGCRLFFRLCPIGRNESRNQINSAASG